MRITCNIPDAARLILAIIRDPEAGMKKKQISERNIGLHEAVLESAPTTIILTYVWVSSILPCGMFTSIDVFQNMAYIKSLAYHFSCSISLFN